MSRSRRPTLDDLKAELQRGGVVEAEIKNPDFHIDGYCDPTGLVVVSPHVQTVLTALHELLHRNRKRMSERRVRRESERILSKMTHSEIMAFYRAYRRKAKRIKRPLTLKTEHIRPDSLQNQ